MPIFGWFGSWTRSYKRNSGVNYAEFCYAKNFKRDFLVKNFGVAKSSVDQAEKSFIGLDTGHWSHQNLSTFRFLESLRPAGLKIPELAI